MMSVTKQVFANYIFNLKIILGAEPAVIILDNAPCHSNIDQDFPEVEIKYLPPYSPFLNPIENSFSVLKSAIKRHLLQFNPLMPNGAFNICCPRDCVSRHNGGTSGAPLKPLRVDSALRALSTLRGLRGAPEVPPLCRETQSLGQQMRNW